MGKKKKKDKYRESSFSYMSGGRIRKIGENLGLNRDDYVIDGGNGRTDRGRSFSKEAYKKAVVDRMNNDYDVRRTMEAAAMSGKKKAKKFAKKGFKDIDSVVKGHELLEKYHKKHQGGGEFSSASDYAGLSHTMVKEDRKKHTASINEEVNSKVDGLRNEFLEKIKEQQKTQVPDQEETVEISDRLATARNQAREIENNAFDGDLEAEAPDEQEQTNSIAQQMLADYKKTIADSLTPSMASGF